MGALALWCDARFAIGMAGKLVQAEQILLGSASAALVVLSGALYALLFAFSRLRSSRALLVLAAAAYLLLCLCAVVLTRALGLEKFWVVVVTVMLIGYCLAPAAIWRLCVGTHEASPPASQPANQGNR